MNQHTMISSRTRQRLGTFPPGRALASAATFAATCLLATAADWPMWAGGPNRNMVNTAEKNVPTEWDAKSKKNIKWVAETGSQTQGNLVVAGGKLFIGTNNEGHKNPKITGDKGVVMCFNAADGKFLWQSVHDKLAAGRVNDWPEQGICSSPCVDGNRVYYVSNRCELVCLDVEGSPGSLDAKVVWKLDMMEELGVFPHNLSTSSPLVVGDNVYILTSNGVDEGHSNIPAPRAPSFIAVNKKTGKVAWENGEPADKIFHGQWGSPSYGVVNGKGQVYFPGGDGYLYALDPDTGKVIWKFNCNPPGAKYILGGRGTANEIISTPVFHDNCVYVGVGQDPEHGEGLGHFYCIDATMTGDVSEKAQKWTVGGKDFGRTISTVAVHDGLVYAAELKGVLHCFDAKTGKEYWNHDMFAAVWGSPYLVDGKIYLGDEDGDVTIFVAGKEKKVIGEINMSSSVYSTAVVANGTLYLVNKSQIFAIEAPKK